MKATVLPLLDLTLRHGAFDRFRSDGTSRSDRRRLRPPMLLSTDFLEVRKLLPSETRRGAAFRR